MSSGNYVFLVSGECGGQIEEFELKEPVSEHEMECLAKYPIGTALESVDRNTDLYQRVTDKAGDIAINNLNDEVINGDKIEIFLNICLGQ